MKTRGKQSGSPRFRSGKWYIAFRELVADAEGNLSYRPTEKLVEGATSRRQALSMGYEQHVSKANAAAHVPQGKATLAQFVEVCWIPGHVSRLKKNGQTYYRSILSKHVLPTLGAMQMDSITTRVVQQLIDAKEKAGLSTQTIKHIRNTVSAIFRHAKRLGFHRGDLPTEGVRLPALQHAQRKALTPAQLAAVIDAVPVAYRPLVEFVAESGCRIGEALGLRWMRVNLTDEWTIQDGRAIAPRSVLIVDNWTRGQYVTTKTASSVRMIPLSDRLVQILATNPGAPTMPVFASREGTPLDGHNIAKRALKPAGKVAGCSWVSWHCFRHTAATRIEASGASPAEKQALLGHASAGMGLRYTHPDFERLRQALNAGKTMEREKEISPHVQ